MSPFPRIAGLICLVLLGACAALPGVQAPRTGTPAAWGGPTPDGQGRLVSLQQWWSGFDDPLLTGLVADAQQASPRLAQAVARVEQARALARAAGVAALPSLDGNASASRGKAATVPGMPAQITTSARLSVDALWEIDLFGRARKDAAAAANRAEAAALQWHDARISLAAETAQAYIGLRACEALAQVLSEEAASQTRLAELTRLKVEGGFEAPANGALAAASAAEAGSRLLAQRAECEVSLQQLSLLTAQDAAALRQRLSTRTALLPRPAAFNVATLPAAVLAQRPDLAASERELRAAAYEVSVAEADRFPRLTLVGSLGRSFARAGGNTLETPFWSIGPSLSLPLLDFGRRAALAKAAEARLDEARAAHEQRLRAAVTEVEESLLRLDAAARREADAERAAQGYRQFFNAAQERWRLGAASQIELEDARRLWLNAQSALVGVRRERVGAWVSLYKAVGGGWDGAVAATAAPVCANPSAVPPGCALPVQ